MNDSTMFQILKAALFTGEAVPVADWKALFQEMKAQAVASLPGVWLEEHPIPCAESWSSYCAGMQGQWLRVMLGQSELADLLEQNRIPFVILKGAAAAMYYPEPSLRSMGDVDLLVKRRDVEKAAVLLEGSGYTLAEGKDLRTYHYSYKKDEILFELHRKLPVIDDADEKLLSLFEDGIDHRVWKETEGFRFPTLPTALNGLVLIYHINQHLRSGLGLRQIIDWMLYVTSLSAEEWSGLRPLLQDTGMEKLALTVTAMCQRYLGLRPIVKDDLSLPVDLLLDRILEAGNFGSKSGTRGRIAMVSMLASEKGGFFRHLQAGGLIRWKAAREHRMLRPFAWVYQAFHILGVLLTKRISLSQLREQTKHGAEQFKLLKELGLQLDSTIQHETAAPEK